MLHVQSDDRNMNFVNFNCECQFFVRLTPTLNLRIMHHVFKIHKVEIIFT